MDERCALIKTIVVYEASLYDCHQLTEVWAKSDQGRTSRDDAAFNSTN